MTYSLIYIYIYIYINIYIYIYVVVLFIFGNNVFLRFLKNQFFYSQSIILRNMRKKISKKMQIFLFISLLKVLINF